MKPLLITLMSVVALLNLGLCVRSLLYNKFFYRRFYTPRFSNDYSPEVAVFVPCKGLEENLESYLEAILHQDYPCYKVTFITESEEDPAADVIKKVISRYPHAQHVISGKAETCCQKNHNLLAAIDRDNVSEVFIFADADIRPNRRWIRDLVLPLSREDIPISTGFRWLTPGKFNIYGTIHSMLSAYICTLMSSSKGVWGGSMAIRRKEFDRYKVYEKWKSSVVDDISLTQIIIKNGLKRVFVPDCIAVSSNVLGSFGANLEWFTRQLMFLKVYCKPLWLSALVVHSLLAILATISIVLLLTGIFISGLKSLTLPALIFLALLMFTGALIKLNYRDRQSCLTWVLLTLPGELIGFLSLVQSALQSNILWRGVLYELNNDGSVKSVQFVQTR